MPEPWCNHDAAAVDDGVCECGLRVYPSRGDRVTVAEPNITPWAGTVLSVKPTRSGWAVDVLRDDGMGFVVPSRYIVDDVSSVSRQHYIDTGRYLTYGDWRDEH